MRAGVPAAGEALAPRGRRAFLQTVTACLASASLAFASEQERALTPDQIIERLKQGNARFRTGHLLPRHYLEQMRATASGQHPMAAILGCIDSRVPAEFVFDAGIGELFNARVAGNVVNDDLIGSLEFSCAASGAQVVLVLGHTACGAIKGAIDGVHLGRLTTLLEKIRPAVDATVFAGEKSSRNAGYVNAIARTNVELSIDQIRRNSQTLASMERRGTIRIAGAMYDITTGVTSFLN